MIIAATQQAFMGQLLEEEKPLPSAWDSRMAVGLEIYRSAYRTRLMNALKETFAQTVKLVGKEAFNKAAAHHLIAHPPGGWTLDLVGADFAATLEGLFPIDPDVADLAWLEWAMHCAFTDVDHPPLDMADFVEATAGFGEQEWSTMVLRFVPPLRTRWVETDCATMWRSLKDGVAGAEQPAEEKPWLCGVWREGHSPVFRLLQQQEGRCLTNMIAGTTFGELCASLAETACDAAAERAGAMLTHWLKLGLVSSIGSGARGDRA